jgi:hypothetical protein
MEPWGLLSAGDRFAVRSHSGNRYELVFLCAGDGESGLFARFSTGKLARFYPEKLDWTTLEKLGESPYVVPGDEILVTLADRELRGRIASTRPESLLVLMANGQAIRVGLDGTVRKTIRLLFAATDWRQGDEFLVTSLSGGSYRGRTLLVTRERIDAALTLKRGLPCTEVSSLRADQLYLGSLRVLIPVPEKSIASV